MSPPGAEESGPDALRAANEALNEQVKLLVQTEQRLYRSRAELDRQLALIRALGEFSLASTSLDSAGGILVRGADLLLDAYRIDRAGVLGLADGPRWFVRPSEGAAHPEPDPELSSWAAEERGVFLGVPAEAPPALRRLLEEHAPPGPVQAVVAIPLRRRAGDAFALALFWTVEGSSFYLDPPAEEHRDILVLFAKHLEHALQNAELAHDLRERGEELERTNARLSASLAELEGAQQQLVQARKMEAIGRLAGGIAHDFNNLLTVILNNARLAQGEVEPGSDTHESLRLILEAGDRGAKITSQLLAFSRKGTPTKERVDLNRLVRDDARMLEGLLGELVVLETRLADDAVAVTADRAQLEQVLLNVVVNARDAMPEGGTVRIETRRADEDDRATLEGEPPDGYRALVVEDDGRGMDERTRAQVFDPFFTTKLLGRGTGLGLSVVYGAVQQNAGKIRVESEPGRGTRVTVLLPSSGAERPTEEPDTPPPRDVRGTVLLVEDEAPIREVAARILRREGLTVLEAGDGASALELADGGSELDVLVTDVVMPGMGGLELASAIRARLPDLAVVFVSGYASELPRASGPREAFLQKPFEPRALTGTVARVLRASPANGA